ncbi:hypothetical protein [Streptomyces sp. VRA16 Mangrove soil]|uniref:hypothetical protein n=1 Tax=Streptomyces sp. VRA16 Mangrove soil TaxID=2817434 RepID=UPI001A9E81C0|nr:hypothetical protein [Streptomyces sp. VRA16 Mangrove soil]MBO1334259.1 hypothetical protein [Streptomyces sp. VRA16 Mangrove soil]
MTEPAPAPTPLAAAVLVGAWSGPAGLGALTRPLFAEEEPRPRVARSHAPDPAPDDRRHAA